MTDTTISINGTQYNVIVYRCAEHGGWRAEAAYMGRVIEAIDTPHESEARDGIRAKLEARCKRSR